MASFSTLTLGTRKDTDWWRRGMKEKVGYAERVWVKQPEPTMQQMKDVFGGRDDWLFFGGHFSGPFSQWLPWPYDTEKRLYNDLDNDPETAPSREVLTRKDNVLLRSKKANGTWEEASLKKGVEFKQTGANRVILWGGCNVCETQTLTILRELYDKPLIIGWKGITSKEIISRMLGGTGNNDATDPWSAVNFWTKLGGNAGNLAKVRDAWLAAANAIWPTEAAVRQKFSVIDPDGTPHELD